VLLPPFIFIPGTVQKEINGLISEEFKKGNPD
jgi:hypothetical protein